MQLFTNAKETRFFLTDDHVKNLHAIEVNSVADIVSKNIVSVAALLRHYLVIIDDIDELVENTAEQENKILDLPDPVNFRFDFVSELSYAEIVIEAINAKEFFDDKEAVVRQVEYLRNAKRLQNGALFFDTPDKSKLVILVDAHTDTIEINTEKLLTSNKEPSSTEQNFSFPAIDPRLLF